MKEERNKGLEMFISYVFKQAVDDEVYALLRGQTDMDVLDFTNSHLFQYYSSFLSALEPTLLRQKFWEGVASQTLKKLSKDQQTFLDKVLQLVQIMTDEDEKKAFVKILKRYEPKS